MKLLRAARLGFLALLVGVLWTFGATIPLASAATDCVNPGGTDGCAASINAAIAAAPSGATITIRAGTYQENVIVAKPITLQGQGDPIIYSAVSNPNCGGAGGSTLCDPNSTIILVRADNVTIAGLVLDGDNPHLHSGVSVGGADIDARNGIVTDFNTRDTTLGLTVRDTVVRNVFRRGIQITSNTGFGTFTFRGNTVSNVQGDPNTSVAIISNGNGNAGTMVENRVSDSSDALNSNWSHGIQFLDNQISHSGSGVHTDNAGGAGGGTPDLIRGNQVDNCQAGGFGVWSFVSYIAPTFEDNTVTKCDVGIAAYGVAAPVTPLFLDNAVHGSGGAGTVGALVSTDVSSLGFSDFNVSAFLAGNTIDHVATGIHVQQTAAHTASASLDDNTITSSGTGIDVDAGSATILNSCVRRNSTGILVHNLGSATAHLNAIEDNSSFGFDNMTAATVDARLNWWGAASGPAPTGGGDLISANVDASSFLTTADAAGSCKSGDD